ncbi:peroxidase 45-like [Panicum miliaceum]|uniref:Peroxidase 45-like n=1 Tax=Panicum miliaceum TaxID=4540 RepID=A0A3L6PDY2_PANMI|nr:peroxidase 45-like [Panicum miliaceum]
MASLGLGFFVAAFVSAAALRAPPAVAQLRPYYYSSICPNLEVIVRSSVQQSMAQSPISAPAALRLFFHDCAVRSGGPFYEVELGRYDGRLSTKASVVLPHANFTLDQLNAFFSGLGFSQSEMIALSGGHTLGAADCPFFQYRIGTDPTMDPNFASQLNSTCRSNPTSGFAFLDSSPVTFYRNLQAGKGLLGSDQVLYSDVRSRGTVNYYATDQGAFFGDFVAAMTKLGRVGVKTVATGEIRRDCRFPN